MSAKQTNTPSISIRPRMTFLFDIHKLYKSKQRDNSVQNADQENTKAADENAGFYR